MGTEVNSIPKQNFDASAIITGTVDDDRIAAAITRDTELTTHAADYALHSRVIRKSADQIVNNSTTLVNDTHLFFAVGANEVWWFSIFLRTKSGTTPDFKWAFTAPDGATITSGACCGVGGSPVNELSGLTGFNFGGTGANAVKDWWNIAIIAGTAGNIQFQWAQNTADASDTKVLANSCIIAHRLA